MEINWNTVEKILIIRLRSIGDAVLSTPSIEALRAFRPQAKIDILLEDWVAPIYECCDSIDEVHIVGRSTSERIKMARHLRKQQYDVVYNFHGGSTSGLFVGATGGKHRVGFKDYRYTRFYNHVYPDAAQFWNKPRIHSAEQQIALVGYSGVPVESCPKTSLTASKTATNSVVAKLEALNIPDKFALIHPAAAYETKRWRTENFARVVEHLNSYSIAAVAVTTEDESPIIERIREKSTQPVYGLTGLSLPEICALSERAEIFIGNDSGIAHIAAAVGKRCVVIFGSSNINVWHPWTDMQYRTAQLKMDCQPCPGDICREFGEPRCILELEPNVVLGAIDELLIEDKKRY